MTEDQTEKYNGFKALDAGLDAQTHGQPWPSIPVFSLHKLYKILLEQPNPNVNRIMAALVDAKIVYSACARSVLQLFGLDNRYRKAIESGEVDSIPFNDRFAMYEAMTTAILKQRALWDKLMGLWILVHVPESYDSYLRGSRKGAQKGSRKAYFKEHILDRLPHAELKKMEEIIVRLDDRYRTHEAHGTGVVRKFFFYPYEYSSTEGQDMMDFHNSLGFGLRILGRSIDGSVPPLKPVPNATTNS